MSLPFVGYPYESQFITNAKNLHIDVKDIEVVQTSNQVSSQESNFIDMIYRKTWHSLIMMFVLVIHLILSILVIVIPTQIEAPLCRGHYMGIAFDYSQWLEILGWTGIGIVSGLFVLLFL